MTTPGKYLAALPESIQERLYAQVRAAAAMGHDEHGMAIATLAGIGDVLVESAQRGRISDEEAEAIGAFIGEVAQLLLIVQTGRGSADQEV